MQTTFLHTADWQLGKPFAGVEDIQKRSLLQQERLNVLKALAESARVHGAEFIVVAGDLFDSPGATRPTVSAACAAIGAMGLPVFVIPGNHDHAGPGSLWELPFFQHEREHLAPNLTVMLRAEPVELDTAVLFPCPLLRRHESLDTTAWLRAVAMDSFGEKARVIVAHGSVQSFGTADESDELESGAVNQIELSRLPEQGFDYVALGDWHGTKQVSARAWYSGTPEIDRFPRGEGNEPGQVLIVTAQRGAVPRVTPVRTGRLRWHQLAFKFSGDAELPRLEEEMDARIGNRAQQDLLLLELSGSLGMEATSRLDQKLEAWQSRVLRMKLVNYAIIAPSLDEITTLTQRTSDPLIARVAARLVAAGEGAGEDAACARIALRELYALCRQT